MKISAKFHFNANWKRVGRWNEQNQSVFLCAHYYGGTSLIAWLCWQLTLLLCTVFKEIGFINENVALLVYAFLRISNYKSESSNPQTTDVVEGWLRKDGYMSLRLDVPLQPQWSPHANLLWNSRDNIYYIYSKIMSSTCNYLDMCGIIGRVS